jgi:hypothetical protein
MNLRKTRNCNKIILINKMNQLKMVRKFHVSIVSVYGDLEQGKENFLGATETVPGVG